MGAEEKPKPWWQTVPALLGAVAAILTAIAGLLAAIHQTGWFGGGSTPPAVAQETSVPASVTQAQAPAASSSPEAPSARRPPGDASLVGERLVIGVPEAFDLGIDGMQARYQVIDARLSQPVGGQPAVKVKVRMWNRARHAMNFSSSGFRLVVDGLPRAPATQLNRIVHADEAGEAELEFILDTLPGALAFRVNHYDMRRDVPLTSAVESASQTTN